ncbi:MAG TPA: glycosyltransferase family 4 protein [Pyrinomonadaceae bacterium]|nr:glycosyltransferase family 4 protein [Pyrinomonadaceae bacterium]
MRILQISSAASFAGGERHVVDLTNALVTRGHELYAAVRPNSPLIPQLRIRPANIKTLPLRNAFDVVSARQLESLVEQQRIDVVHAHMARDYSLAAYATRRNSTSKLVVTRHVLFPLNRFHKRTLAHASRIIAVSEATARCLKSQALVPPEKIAVIRNGIDVDRFRQARGRSAYRVTLEVPDNCKLIGTIGELRRLKRHDDFIKAAAIVARDNSDAYFVLAGSPASSDAVEQKSLEELVNKLGLTGRFRFLGWLDDAAALLGSLNVFVSASETESFGLVIAEAMASGAVVVATATEGAREIISEGETGLVVPIGAVDQMATAITALLTDEQRRRKLAARGEKRVAELFSVDRMVDETERLYESV